ncbi:MAG TPA: hypothetical protein DEH78_30110 [Solibacterales bacterium]|nr:hypothetical protein [Bryobacterales bacterium]
MNAVKLLIAVLILAALGAGVWYSEKSKKDEAPKDAASDAPKILTIPEDQIAQVEIRKRDAAPVVVKRQGTNWRLAAPAELPAEDEAVGSVVNTLAALSSERLVEEKAANLADFGLAQPLLEVVVTKKDGKSERLLIGDETPTGSSYYAKLGTDAKVYSLAGWNKSALDKTARDLRDKRMLTFDASKLSRLEVRAKGLAYEFGKNASNEWQIVKPQPLRADSGKVEELIRKLSGAKLDTLLPEDEAAKLDAKFASATPLATAAATDAAGTQTLEVRKGSDNNYYAKSSAVPGAQKLAATELGEEFAKPLEELRNKKLFDFGFTEPQKVEVREGATTAWTFTKTGDDWTAADKKKMDPALVQSLIDRLRDLSAAKFTAAGFTVPVMELTVLSDQGKRTEKVLVSKSGAAFVAKRDQEPALYELAEASIEEIRKAAAAVKPAPPATPAPKALEKK